ncbi:MAG: hypothetical protein FWC67_02210 [Defluviitaleaceae bacterium]|nr:hypothetical protein [Defluviitaleaceae bacterium]
MSLFVALMLVNIAILIAVTILQFMTTKKVSLPNVGLILTFGLMVAHHLTDHTILLIIAMGLMAIMIGIIVLKFRKNILERKAKKEGSEKKDSGKEE